jgi:hypothetical protein
LCYQTLNGRDPSKEEVELCATLSYIPLKNVEEALERYQQANTLIHDNNLRGIGTLATTVENDEILSTSPSVPDHVQKEEAARYVETLPAKCLRRKVTLPPTGSAPEAHKCPDCGKAFESSDSYKRHMTERYPKNAWLCLLCLDVPMNKPGKISFRPLHFRNHYEKKHKGIHFQSYLDRGHFSVRSRSQGRPPHTHSKPGAKDASITSTELVIQPSLSQVGVYQPVVNSSMTSVTQQARQRFGVLCVPATVDPSLLQFDRTQMSPGESILPRSEHIADGLPYKTPPSACPDLSKELESNSGGDSQPCLLADRLDQEESSPANGYVASSLGPNEEETQRSPTNITVAQRKRDSQLLCPRIMRNITSLPQALLSRIKNKAVQKLALLACAIAKPLTLASNIYQHYWRHSSRSGGNEYCPREIEQAGKDTLSETTHPNVPGLTKQGSSPTIITLSFFEKLRKQQMRRGKLAYKLFECRIQSGIESNQHFIPWSSLEKCLDKPSIRCELHKLEAITAADDFSLMIDEIFTSLRRIFAILIMIGQEDEIPRFLEKGISDKDLPYEGPFDKGKQPRKEVSSSYDLKDLVQDWPPWTIEAFQQAQWTVLAPIFDHSYKHYKFTDHCILPFQKPGTEVRTGGFGDVFTVQIHPSHHDAWPLRESKTSPTIAVKRLRSDRLEDFENETRMLREHQRASAHFETTRNL